MASQWRTGLYNGKGLVILILALLVFHSINSVAQNLVPNPSFEEGEDYCEVLTFYKYFDPLATHWKCPSFGTSDVFSTKMLDECYGAVPYSEFRSSHKYENVGSQLPRTGDRFAGIYTFTKTSRLDWSGYREYLQVKLNETLIPGEPYCVEMWVSLGGGSAYASNNLGMAFTVAPYFANTYFEMPLQPVYFESKIIADSTEWVKIGGNFIATEASNYLTIGNFFKDNQTSFAPFNNAAITSETSWWSYYFIDDVSVKRAAPINDKFVFSGSTTICAGQTTRLVADIGSSNVRWFTLTEPIDTVAIGKTLRVKPLVTTSYRVTASSCTDYVEEIVTITVKPSPQISLGSDTILCKGDSFMLDGGAGFTSYAWNNGSTDRFLNVHDRGLYSITVEGENGCKSNDTIMVYLEDIPKPALGNDTIVCKNFFPLVAGSGYKTYEWSTHETTAAITPKASGKYWVFVMNQCGEASDTINVFSYHDIYIPNVVTSNGDGLNDEFKIGVLQPDSRAFETFSSIKGSLIIYNRWGDKIYTSSDYSGHWPNGENNLSSDVYYYSFHYLSCYSKGWIQVIK